MSNLLKPDRKCEIIRPNGEQGSVIAPLTIMEDRPEIASKKSALEDESLGIEESARRESEEILSPFPNDLTRLIYLASIRDYNSGTYRHPVLSRRYEAMVAHRAFQICHKQVFGRLLTDPINKYVEQLEGYIRYSRAERDLFITAWKSLQAYRATIPLQVSTRASELFSLNVKIALSILERLQERQSAAAQLQ